MSKYAGTKTEANLRAAFAGESQARNQYTFFASVAKKEGYEQMAASIAIHGNGKLQSAIFSTQRCWSILPRSVWTSAISITSSSREPQPTMMRKLQNTGAT